MPDIEEPKVTATYVNKLLAEMQEDLRGLHTKMSEIEDLRHYEDKIKLPPGEKASGLEVRIGATAELIENIKAALTANVPNVIVKALRSGDTADKNSSKREKFWGDFLDWISRPVPILNELADAQAGLGMGILKGTYYPWPKKERERLGSEPRTKDGDKAYNDRQRALKRKWGPPFRVITIHPLTFYFRLGPGNEIVESIEHSWKSKREIYAAYKLGSDAELTARPDLLKLEGASEELAEGITASIAGQPEQTIRPFAAGVSSETMVLVTEYRADDIYQVYVNGRLVDECIGDPGVKYFVATGRTTSSKDPDKFGISVAEAFRHNEPILNRTITRMAEAAEVIVRKRLTIEAPEGTMLETELGEGNEIQTKTFKFTGEKATALPPGSKIVDPFAGVENVYQAMPFVQLLMQLMGQHGVSPIFKGVPPGAGGSGYRDNSLYLMAKSQFQYLLDSFANCLAEMIDWMEQQLVTRAQQEIWIGELSLRPSDVQKWPATINVSVEPLLPQNIIAEGQFYDRMHARGHIRRRTVLEKGLRDEQPEEELWGVMLEELQEMMKPVLYQDVLQAVGAIPPPQPEILGPDGQPVQSQGSGRAGGFIPSGGNGSAQAAIVEALQSMGGRTRQGQPRQPPEEAGAFPPGQAETGA